MEVSRLAAEDYLSVSQVTKRKGVSHSEKMPTTGAELMAYWRREGLIGTRPDITDSVEHGRAIRRKAECREQSTRH